MKVYISIRVRNPEWFWSKERMKEDGDYRPTFEMINEDKIQKHTPTFEFDFTFEVKEFNEKESDPYELEIYKVVDEKVDSTKPIKVELEDVRVINFIGENDQSSVIVSNSLIYQYIGNKKQHGKHYFYIYIKENVNVIKADYHIWLSEKEIERIDKEHGPFVVKPDEKINTLGFSGMM